MINIVLKPIQHRPTPQQESSNFMIVNWRISSDSTIWHPPTDIFEREDALVVRVEIAGMNDRDFAISLDQNHLLIRGVRQDTSERGAYHQMEINFGEFSLNIDLPIPIDDEHVTAEYQNGFLWVILPKAQPKKISLKENE